MQLMTGLREIWLIAGSGGQDLSKRSPDVPGSIQGLLDSIPAGCRVRIGASQDEEAMMLKDIGSGLNYAFNQRATDHLQKCLVDNRMFESVECLPRRGIFSGSKRDHGACGGGVCRTGQACVNSSLGGGKLSLREREQLK